jgi:hypothetical protein
MVSGMVSKSARQGLVFSNSLGFRANAHRRFEYTVNLTSCLLTLPVEGFSPSHLGSVTPLPLVHTRTAVLARHAGL